MIYSFLAVISVIFALLIIWKVSFFILKKKKIGGVFPFFILGVLFLIYSTFIIFEFFSKWYWFFLKFFIFLVLFWILIKLKGVKNGS